MAIFRFEKIYNRIRRVVVETYSTMYNNGIVKNTDKEKNVMRSSVLISVSRPPALTATSEGSVLAEGANYRVQTPLDDTEYLEEFAALLWQQCGDIEILEGGETALGQAILERKPRQA